MENTKSFKKIVFKREAISNLDNNQMKVVVGGETFPTMCWACTDACYNLSYQTLCVNCNTYLTCTPTHCDTEYVACTKLTLPTGTSICYDVCY